MRVEKVFQLQSMSNAMIFVYQSFAVNNLSAYCLVLIFDLSNPKMKVQQAKNGFKFTKFDESFNVFFDSSIRTFALVVK